MVYVFLAEGFEEIEALTPVDCLRRAGITVQTVGVGGSVIKGSHGIPVAADLTEDAIQLNSDLDMIVLPGGMPGTLNLGKSEAVQSAIAYCAENDRWITAICAAPSILGDLGLLSGRKATCYPGFEARLTGCTALAVPTVRDGRFITGRGPGAAMDFALELIAVLADADKAGQIADGMVHCK